MQLDELHGVSHAPLPSSFDGQPARRHSGGTAHADAVRSVTEPAHIENCVKLTTRNGSGSCGSHSSSARALAVPPSASHSEPPEYAIDSPFLVAVSSCDVSSPPEKQSPRARRTTGYDAPLHLCCELPQIEAKSCTSTPFSVSATDTSRPAKDERSYTRRDDGSRHVQPVEGLRICAGAAT